MRKNFGIIGVAASLVLGGCGEGQQAPPPSAPQQADEGPGVRDPLAFVQAVYGRYARGQAGTAPQIGADVYSPRLAALSGGESLGFDPWINGQDVDVQGLIIQEAPPPAPDRRMIAARFRNAGQPVSLQFAFVRAGRRWQLDDVVSEAQGETAGWRLSELLQAEAGGERPPS